MRAGIGLAGRRFEAWVWYGTAIKTFADPVLFRAKQKSVLFRAKQKSVLFRTTISFPKESFLCLAIKAVGISHKGC